MMFGFYASLDPTEDLSVKVASEPGQGDKPAAGGAGQDNVRDGTTLERDGDGE